MKVAVVYNRESQRVINLFGVPNREKYGLAAIRRISNALRKGGHKVRVLEGDKDLITHLEDFMPRVVKGERPGMVLNLSYGIQGQARYTHVPGILEMIGLPYVGSGPLAHSLALDKVVSKMLFVQNGLPTPDFAVLDTSDFPLPDLEFPLIVKPKNEAVSFGMKVVHDESELREAAETILREFEQPVLVERYIEGREINVGLLGNRPAESLPPAEILFGEGGPPIYTYEDKTRKSGREIHVECPAKLDPEVTAKAQEIARRAFEVLGCYDCARVDMRLDKDGRLYILEVNSLPSLGEHGSYVQGAAAIGLDFPALVNRLIDVAAARYFGVPHPPELGPAKATQGDRIVSYLSARRDRIEKELKAWTNLRSRTADPVGIHEVVKQLDDDLTAIGFRPIPRLTDPRVVWAWSNCGDESFSTLLVGHLDVPVEPHVVTQRYRQEPEWLYGEGIGSSRAPLVSMLAALQALRRVRLLRRRSIGIVYYADEGRDCRYSAELIRQAMSEAQNVLVLRPGNPGDSIVTARRGQRLYRLSAEGEAIRLGKTNARREVLPWVFEKLQSCAALTSRKERIAVAALDVKTTHMPMLLPHHVTCSLLVSYPDEQVADHIESQLKDILSGREVRCKLQLVSARPPMKERRANLRLAKQLQEIAREWEIPLKSESSVWPSVAGLAPSSTRVVCALGPVARNIYTPDESVDRVSLLQRSVLLAQFLASQGENEK